MINLNDASALPVDSLPVDMPKKKIAILGGGFAGVGAAFTLTSEPGWQDKYDVTLYTLGWRLGGKCAASRHVNGRIEEHGIHVFLGFYETMFANMRQCYDELKANGTPAHYGTWDNALIPQNQILLMEYFDGKWLDWLVNFPVINKTPAESSNPSDWENMNKLVTMMVNLFNSSAFAKDKGYKYLDDTTLGKVTSQVHNSLLGDAEGLVEGALDSIKSFFSDVLKLGEHDIEGYFLQIASNIMKKAEMKTSVQLRNNVVQLIGGFINWLEAELAVLGTIVTEIRRIFLLMQIAYYNLKGMMFILQPDGSLDFESINHLDYREWLLQLRAPDNVIYSSPVRDIYTLVFAYDKGDTFTTAGNLEAGTALRGVMAIVLGYNGSVMYKFKGATSDVTFTPLYDLLKARGVKFEFFQKTEKLNLSADGKSIDSISMQRQVRLKDPKKEYTPHAPELIKGMKVWPADPNYNQLDPEQAKQLQEKHINLESYWADWKGEDYTLTKGVDYDAVICAISIGALKPICADLYNDPNNNNKWKNMLDNVQTTRTQAVQLWMNKTVEELGGVKDVITDVLPDPINSWGDFSDLIEYENWPENNTPKSIAYFCGPMVDDPFEAPYSDTNYPLTQWVRVNHMAAQWLNDNADLIFPKGEAPFNPDGLDFTYLTPAKVGLDVWQNFASQFFRANIDPTERYVLSLTGTTKFRIKQGETGYDNLFISGDWTKGHYNVGCAEETVLTAKLCAEAVMAWVNASFVPRPDQMVVNPDAINVGRN
ncbi:MAG: NAD(P)-binding protein [Bacteroidetes bacterium]|nr:NAD(P)-binding protein [Bacteroidota bacterium]